MNTKTTVDKSPFHKGEHIMQAKAGKREAIEKIGRKIIRSFMPDQHREFYQQLPFLVVGSVDQNGFPWASILTGKPGFAQSPSPTSLVIDAKPIEGDPLTNAFSNVGNALGILGIEIPTRRRNRLNARITKINDKVELKVDQSFGNCPQYIQTRDFNYVREPGVKGNKQSVKEFNSLDKQAKKMIQQSDTFFVSSYVVSDKRPDVEGVDVSHRGGMPGFVKVDGDTLTIPDYSGNFSFNTLGNFLLNPKAGLVFPDFETGDLLMLTGHVELLEEDHPEVVAFKGAERGWRFTVEKGKWLKDALPFRAVLKEYSPNSEITGTWGDAQAVIDAEELRNSWQPLRLVKVEDESSVIKSFYFEHADEKALLPFQAGQYLTIRVSLAGSSEKAIRTYTLSSAPHDRYYRISVKKEPAGVVSSFLHEQAKVGDVIKAKAPLGDFYIDASVKRPAVLLAGGVGITPMISMAQHIANEGIRTRFTRPLTIFHAAKSTGQRAFANEFRQLQKKTQGAIRYFSFVSDVAEHEQQGVDYHGSGHVTANILRQVLALDDYDFYLCGPATFMQAMYDALVSLGVRDMRIYAEAFGPAVLIRTPDEASHAEAVNEAEHSIIKFVRSDTEQHWNKGDETILEVAEKHGLNPEFGCRNGVCGSCSVRIKSGEVSYRNKPAAPVNEGEVLICCAVPANKTEILEVDL